MRIFGWTIIAALVLAGAADAKPVKRAVHAAHPAKPAAPKPEAAPAALPDTPEIAELRRAFQFAYPIYEVMKTRTTTFAKVKAAAGIDNPVNILLPRLKLQGADSHDVTTPNNDTLYATSFLDLSQGPVILTVPPLPRRYHSAALMSALTDNIAVVGTRTGGQGGRYAIAGPGFTGPAPADTQLIKMPTNDTWLLVRVLVNGPADLAAASEAIGGFRVEGPAGAAFTPVTVAAVAEPDAKTFVNVVTEALARSGQNSTLIDRAKAFPSLGLPVGWDQLSPETQALWTASLPGLRAELKGGISEIGETVDGWTYPRPGLGEVGGDDRTRALVAMGGLAMLPRVEAIYLTARTGADGAPLDGAKAYRVHIPAHVPAGAFWSLTMYRQEAGGGLYFVPNALERFAIGDRSPQIRAEEDGSFDIFVQVAKPTGERVVNWLPAPKGKFVLVFRAYLPRDAMLDGTFRLPAVVSEAVIP